MEILAALFLVLVLVAAAAIVTASGRERALQREEGENSGKPGPLSPS